MLSSVLDSGDAIRFPRTMSNLPMTIGAVVAKWRAGRSVAELREVYGLTLTLGHLDYQITPLPLVEGEPLVVRVDVLGAGKIVLAQSNLKIVDD
jgi:hypothetical protein